MKTSLERKTRRLLLLGAGHAQIGVLRGFAMRPDPQTELVLVNPSAEALYSGMLPGFIAGQYRWKEISLNVAALAERAGAIFIQDRGEKILPRERLLQLENRPAISYDYLSIDIGSTAALPALGEGVAHSPRFLATRPFTLFRDRLAGWDRDLETNREEEVLVLGSGPAGFELACALRARYPQSKVKLLEGLHRLSSQQRQALDRLKISTSYLGRISALSLSGNSFELKAETGMARAQRVVCALGAVAHPLIAQSGLPNVDGFLQVNEFLQSDSHREIFGAGDCVHFASAGLPKAGVYAVRESPVLEHNLRASLHGLPLQTYRPQKRFLRLLNTADDSAIAEWGPFSAQGRWAWRWKDQIDRKFMGMYQMTMPPVEDPDCGGCGSKAAAEVVCELRAPGPQQDNRVIWGVEAAEDVALWEGSPGQKIAITIDQFKNFGADPYLFGRITAIAAASDLYAKGIAPEAALMFLAMPKLSSALAKDWARQLRQGVQSVFAAERISLLGGHTVESEEWSLGFTLWGSARDALWPKRGAHPGDTLLLTKPLGTGILLAAHMQGAASGSGLEACLRSMSQSQRCSWEVLGRLPVNACTDVTGFSLLGHLSEMLAEDSVSAELTFSAIPFLEQAESLFARGYHSRMQKLNQRSFPIPGLRPEAEILYDPQTSGGLLAALSPENAQKALAELQALGVEAACIGRLTQASEQKIRVLF